MDTSKLAKPIGEAYLNNKIFRDRTKHPVRKMNFFLEQGGLGDYICHMPAFEYIANECPHVHGNIFVNPPFTELATHIMKPYKHWRVFDKRIANQKMKNGEMMFSPEQYNKFINACGAHLLDLGFMYYCNLQTPPDEYNRMTNLSGHFDHKFDLPNRYAVVTPGATSKARTMPPHGFNKIVDYLISKKITPVFLGKKDFAHQGKESDYYASIDPSYNLEKGINLLEITNLFEAIAIMEKAKMVIGLDNGLLHMAGTTSVPIIFGHSVTTVEHRSIRRTNGRVINISLKDLSCSGCQSRMRFIPGHRFKYCIYDDYVCLDLLFTNDAKAWRDAIDSII